MTNALEDLLRRLRDSLDDLDQADKELAENVAKDSAALFARKLQGDDVDAELDHVKAQAANLGTAAALRTAQVFRAWLGDLLGFALDSVFAR